MEFKIISESLLEKKEAGHWKPFANFKNKIMLFEHIKGQGLLVLISWSPNIEDRNLFLVDEVSGQILWQVENAKPFPADSRHPNRGNPYINFSFENGKLLAGSMIGFDQEIDLKTGASKLVGFSK